MFCNNCGTSNPEGAKFCSSCGAKLVSKDELKVDSSNPKKRSTTLNNTNSPVNQKGTAEKIAVIIKGIGSLIALLYLGSSFLGIGDIFSSSTPSSTTRSSSYTTSSTNNSVPREYRNALRAAEQYNKVIPMSKKKLYTQLTSHAGEKFSPDAASYAVENVNANWKENALKCARKYDEIMPMSKSRLYNQLTSSAGERFTAEEAQYAIDNLK